MVIVARVDRLLEYCVHLFLVLANSCLAVMLIINVLNISSRAILDRGLQWVFPWSTVLFVWMSFFGFFVLYRLRRDITVDFFYDRFGKTGQMVIRQFVNLLIILLMAVMIWHGPEVIERQAGIIEQVYFLGHQVQRYTLGVPLFISCGLILINYIVDMIYAVRGENMPSFKPSKIEDY